MTSTTKSDYLIPGGLLVLSLVPFVAGAARLVQLAGGAEVTPENARFFAAPVPAVLHIASALLYSVVGAGQFSPGLRHRHPGAHRAAGAVVVASGLLAALSALWLTLASPLGHGVGPHIADFDGRALYCLRLVVGTAMALFLGLGVARLVRRDFRGHGAWMLRAYALGLGAGTQVLTHLPWFLFPAVRGETARTCCMAAGWILNALVAEWLIARPARRRAADAPLQIAAP
jgi:hypothetical protein